MLIITPEARERAQHIQGLIRNADLEPGSDNINEIILNFAARWSALDEDTTTTVRITPWNECDFGFAIERPGRDPLYGGIVLHSAWLRRAVAEGWSESTLMYLFYTRQRVDWGIHS